MALTARLELKAGQQLVMTPQLQQAIKLLQLSNIELNQFVETELERNPLLERDDGDPPVNGAAELASANGATANGAGETSALNGSSDTSVAHSDSGADDTWVEMSKSDADPTGTLDTDYDNVYPDTSNADFTTDLAGSAWSSARPVSSGFTDENTNLEAYVASSLSLKDHLAQQLPLSLTDGADRLIGQYLIDLIDEAGYLNVQLDELADKLGAEPDQITRILGVLQTFDPPGVFARSLADCLAIQLREQNRYDPQIAVLLDNLHLLASHDVGKLRKLVGCDMDELAEMIAEIKQLNPKPGLSFGSEQIQPVVPDVLVRPANDGSWIVELNSDTLPRVLVNRTYYTRVNTSARSDADKDYITDCLNTANWLVKSLDQRARTILRVAEEIVRQQDGFFTHGVQHLRPLNLKTVAEAISMHESTVSRVTSNKYVATTRGIFELKYFFTSAIASAADGEAHSSESVRHRIRQLIDGETPCAVLSDDRIVDLLRGDGIDIARRTVAKYREAMRIPSSVQRRREKRLSAQMAR